MRRRRSEFARKNVALGRTTKKGRRRDAARGSNAPANFQFSPLHDPDTCIAPLDNYPSIAPVGLHQGWRLPRQRLTIQKLMEFYLLSIQQRLKSCPAAKLFPIAIAKIFGQRLNFKPQGDELSRNSFNFWMRQHLRLLVDNTCATGVSSCEYLPWQSFQKTLTENHKYVVSLGTAKYSLHRDELGSFLTTCFHWRTSILFNDICTNFS